MKHAVLAVAAVLVCLNGHAQTSGDTNPPLIIVTGNADMRVAPDQAIVRAGIMRQASAAEAAQEQANAVANEIFAAVAKVGVPAAQIQTSRLTLSPVFGPRGLEGNQPPRIVSYQASNVISVRLEDLAKIGPVIDAALKAGANELQGVQFGLRDDFPSRQQALKEAVLEARKKAETIAEALNVHLGNVMEVTESGVSVAPRAQDAAPYIMTAARAAEPTPVSPGQLEVHASVTLRYRIVP